MNTNYLYIIEWMLLAFFLASTAIYYFLVIVGFFRIRNYMRYQGQKDLPGTATDYMPPITLLIPAYNESATILHTLESAFRVDYPNLEIVVINDGSTDNTMELLTDRYNLKKHPEVYREEVETEPVNAVYRSRTHDNLRVIDKENGQKSDALNAGLNIATTPLVCCMDAGCIMEPEGLKSLAQPFVTNSGTVAAGGTVRILNGCKVQNGEVVEARLPDRLLGMFQVIEYLRAYLFGRMGWEPFNAILGISGAFGMHKREVVVNSGGYKRGAVAEDMEIIVRLHDEMVEQGKDYKIAFVPDPIVWTQTPDSYGELRKQRIRWQRGICQNLDDHSSLLFKRGSGAAGWLAYPYYLFIEVLGPVLELGGYTYLLLGLYFGYLATPAFLSVFLFIAIGLGMLLSLITYLIEQISFHVYDRDQDIAKLLMAAITENLGYRQLNSLWRFEGLIAWLFAGEGSYEEREKVAQFEDEEG